MSTSLHLLKDSKTDILVHIKVAYIGLGSNTSTINDLSSFFNVHHYPDQNVFEEILNGFTFLELPDILLIEVDDSGSCFSLIDNIKNTPPLQGLIIILIAQHDRFDWRAKAVELKVHDFYTQPFKSSHLCERIKFLIKLRVIRPLFNQLIAVDHKAAVNYKMPFGKRAFDIVLSAIMLFLLSPLYIIIAAAIALETKGSVIYKSKRVGTGYSVFDFYKFRSMDMNADTLLTQLGGQNQYNANPENSKSVYFKIINDPRVTKVGRFLRNTSLDELPQLFNILIGDMSFVGNRPLPLYEAEQLTSNEWSVRFLSPAGLTGLWQISKRGKKDMSELERKELDNHYARQYSFWLDLKILIYTIPALIQQEKV